MKEPPGGDLLIRREASDERGLSVVRALAVGHVM